jgi:hypothetical protein
MLKINYDVSNGHENLFLEMPEGGIEETADSYYFALDNFFMPNEESTYKVISNIKFLLEGWITILNSIQKNDIAFLPFDYSDEYIGGLIVKQYDDLNVYISFGYTTKYTGSGMAPSQFEKIKLNQEDLRGMSPSILKLKSELLNEIQSSIKSISSLASIDRN